MENDRFPEIFYASKERFSGKLGKLQGVMRPALEEAKKGLFKYNWPSLNEAMLSSHRSDACLIRTSTKSAYTQNSSILCCPKAGGIRSLWNDKVLEYYHLEKDFEGGI